MNWLFLRGLARSQKHWADFPHRFETKIEGAKVCCLDNPGFGTEQQSQSPLSVAAIQENLRGRWLSLAETQSGPWAILGISLGGMIAYHWLKKDPQDFEAAVFINSSAANLGKPWERLQLSSFVKLLGAVSTLDSVEREKRILRISCERPFSDLPFPPEGVSVKQALRQLVAATRFKIAGRLSQNSLLLCSLKDQIVSPKVSQNFGKAVGSSIRVHASAGHDIPLDDPDWTIQQIADWLEMSGTKNDPR
ncbi:MAG: alpha/beta hydrolase [Bradymonadales bacterium]|nr:MAG: alpha/beta hydrolase [Bradymonadales bacterium]